MIPEQALQQHSPEFSVFPQHYKDNILSSMQLYASQQSIAFAEWIADNSYSLHDGFWYEPPMYVHEGSRGICVAASTPALYLQFIEHQKNNQ